MTYFHQRYRHAKRFDVSCFRCFLLTTLVLILGMCENKSYGHADQQENDRRPSDVPFQSLETLSVIQKEAVITIEFNFNDTLKISDSFLDNAYRKVRRAIIDYLNSRSSTSTTATTAPRATDITDLTGNTTAPTATDRTDTTTTNVSLSSATSTTILNSITTTMPPITMTTASGTTTEHIMPHTWGLKRKKRNKSSFNEYEEVDLIFVAIDPELTKIGILRMSLYINKPGTRPSIVDQSALLFEAVQTLRNDVLLKAVGAPVVAIYRGLPDDVNVPQPSQTAQSDYRVWVPVLVAILVLLIIIICACYWINKKRSTKKLRVTEEKRVELQQREL